MRLTCDDVRSIWVLYEFEDEADEGWRAFTSEEELLKFSKKESGEPLHVPTASLTPDESEHIVSSFNALAQLTRTSVAAAREDGLTSCLPVCAICRQRREAQRKVEKAQEDLRKYRVRQGEAVRAWKPRRSPTWSRSC
jgi:hypothetical protein